MTGMLGLVLAATVAVAPMAATGETIATARDAALRMTVPAWIDDRGPFAFTVDTAADRSVVSDRLAATLALPAAEGVTIHGVTGADPVATVRVERLRVGAAERRGIAAPVLPQGALGAAGFLGLDALAGRTVILDFKRSRLSSVATRREPDGDGDTITVTGRSRFGQLILTDARVGSEKVYAIVDTGAENTIGNLALRRLLRGTAPLAVDGRIVGVTGSTMAAETGTVPRIRLGGMAITNMPVAYADVHTFARFGIADAPALLIGMDVLRRFERVAIDFRRREARFRIGEALLPPG